MCGFAGFIDNEGLGDDNLLKAMADTLLHRGPDDSGYEFFRQGMFSIGMGFRRLSIIDLSAAGHQPMFSADGKIRVMLNGEIYNYREIRDVLISKGYEFCSGSDTEVVMHAYQCWGIGMLDRLNGMFAMAICDLQYDLFYLVRDRAGVKPLFWYHKRNDVLLFASELKAFHQHPKFEKNLDVDSAALFFRDGSIPAPYTIFSNTRKVKPGHWVRINLKDFTCTEQAYWSAFDAFNRPVSGLSYEDAREELKKLMKSAFSYRMIADVPVGVFLSGGYDSTAVAALLSDSISNLNTYTIGFTDRNYDESVYAARVAHHLGTIHHEYTCSASDALGIIPQLPDIFDEPFGDASAVPTVLVSRIARRHVTVALSADAGDELFAGYQRHQKALRYLSRWGVLPSFIRRTSSLGLSALNKIIPGTGDKHVRLSKLEEMLSAREVFAAFHAINQTFTANEVRHLVIGSSVFPKTVFDEGSSLGHSVPLLSKILALEYRTYLVDDVLQKVDRATMSVGLEGREPFLDHRLLEFTATLPPEFKLKDGVSKRILKDIVHEFVPREMMERPKMGFNVPIHSWFINELREYFEQVLETGKIKGQGVLDPDMVSRIKDDFIGGNPESQSRLWHVFCFQQWYDRWMA